MNDMTTRSMTRTPVIMLTAALAYLTVEYASHAFRVPSPFFPQFLLAPLLPLNQLFKGMLDVDSGGIAHLVRAAAFAAIALGAIWPFARYRQTGSKHYLAISITLWLWYALSVIAGILLVWAMHNSGWTD